MSLPPLTHHEILGLVEPFTRGGRRVDLEATDRIERRLAFKPLEHPDPSPAASPLRENLELANPRAGVFRLTRVLTHDCGLQARLVTEGPEPGPLLALVDAIPPHTQFRSGPGYVIALGHRLEAAAVSSGAAPAERLLLTRGDARVGGLTLVMRMPEVRRYPADLELVVARGDPIALPEDLIAVIGWDWARLSPSNNGWVSKLRLRGKGAEQSRGAEVKLERTVRHLAQTFAEPPRRFHERLVGARWGVAFRRAIPLLTGIGLIVFALSVPRFGFAADSPFRLLVFNITPLLLAAAFCLQEMPRIEIPPLPRPSRAAAWRPAPASPPGET